MDCCLEKFIHVTVHGRVRAVKRRAQGGDGNSGSTRYEKIHDRDPWKNHIKINATASANVGAVTWPYYLKTRGQKTLNEFLQETIALCPKLAQRRVDAKLGSEVEATGNFSYRCDRTHGDNFLLLGDAFAFIDPVFSSGVMLAMQNALDGADTVGTCLRHPHRTAATLKKFDGRMRLASFDA